MLFLETLLIGIITLLIGGMGKVFIYDNKKEIWIWIKKQKLKIFPVNFNIAFSLDFEEGLNSGQYFQQIKNNFQKIIDDAGLSENIKVIDFSDIQKFTIKKEAEKFRSKKNIDLIIWGNFSKDGLKEKNEAVSEMHLNFTYGHPNDKDGKIGAMILLDISSKFALKEYWKIFESNSLNDVNIISNNIFALSMYTVALTLKIYGKIDKSIDLFEKLLNLLLSSKDDFSKHVIFHLMNCYYLVVVDEGVGRKNFRKGIDFCLKMLKFENNNLFALANVATFQYKLGEKEDAEKNVELMLELYPKNSSTEIDVAFIRILQGNYSNAYKHYENLIKMKDIQFNPFEVIEFLYNEYENSKEPALLYGSGILSFYWGDKELGKKDLKIFLKKSNDVKYKKLRIKARKLI